MSGTTDLWIDVAAQTDVVADEPLGVMAGDLPVALFRIEEQIFALYDLCSHGAARLSDGFVEDGCVECPLHQGLIRIATGAPASAPITEPVRTFPVRIAGERVEIQIKAD
jgi:anthranilate 1,2-dioxygenase ferredoxin subunit